MDVISIGKYLKEIIGSKKAFLYPNPDNAGDALFALGTNHLFDKVDLNCMEVKDKSILDPEVSIFISRVFGNQVKYYMKP